MPKGSYVPSEGKAERGAGMTNKEAIDIIETLLNVDYSELTQDQADRLDKALTMAFDKLREDE